MRATLIVVSTMASTTIDPNTTQLSPNVKAKNAQANVNTKNARGQTLLYQAVNKNLVDVARFLIDIGADVHATNGDG
jgi:ankyrin repeat protein